MAETSTLARPYATAAFEYALAKGDLEDWSRQLAIAAAVASGETMRRILSSPSMTAARQAQTFIDVCGDSLNEKGGNFIKVLAENRRLVLLPAIYSIFQALKASQEKSVDVDILTAMELDGETQEKLAQTLSKKLDRSIRVNTIVDKNLLGGIIVKAGDLVIDASVRGRLTKLAEAINS